MFAVSLYMIFLTSFIFLAFPTRTTTDRISHILVLGGNGFMGSSVARKLFSVGKNVTILNRGSWYFDSRSRIEPYVNRVLCDRSDIHKCASLVHSTQYYDAVVDFTSYYGEDIQVAGWYNQTEITQSSDNGVWFEYTAGFPSFLVKFSILTILRGRYERYIYISSDSVYEVCVRNSHGGPNREDDAVRSRHPQERHMMNKKDSYGHRKLECEEMLEKENKAHGINFVSLRLPDVIGPRDTTNRFWSYQIWLQSHDLAGAFGPVHLHPKKNKPISFVYSEDVSELILILLDASLHVYNEAYNVAFSPVTLEEFLEMMAESLGIKDVVFDRSKKANVHWYPSVTRGPVDITKISEKLSWMPSSFKEAVRASCRFYRDAMNVPEYQNRRDTIMKRYIYEKETWNRFLKEQGVNLDLHDEL